MNICNKLITHDRHGILPKLYEAAVLVFGNVDGHMPLNCWYRYNVLNTNSADHSSMNRFLAQIVMRSIMFHLWQQQRMISAVKRFEVLEPILERQLLILFVSLNVKKLKVDFSVV